MRELKIIKRNKMQEVFIKYIQRLLPTFISLFFLVTVFAYPLQGQVYMTESGHAEFDSSVPLHTFTGVSDHLVGKINLDDSTVDFYLDVNTLKTGISKRDKDMLETLNAEEFPFAEFFGKLKSPFDPDEEDPQEVVAAGKFTIHGETNNLNVKGTLQKTSDGLLLKANWTTNMEDYDIEPPGILFYRVSENIDIRIEALLTPSE